MGNELSIITLRQTISWFANESNLPIHMRHAGQRVLKFVLESMRAGLVPEVQEEDLAIVSGLTGCRLADRCRPEDIVLPRKELLDLADYYSSQFFARSGLRESIPSTFSFVHFMLQAGVGDGDHDWQILSGYFLPLETLVKKGLRY